MRNGKTDGQTTKRQIADHKTSLSLAPCSNSHPTTTRGEMRGEAKEIRHVSPGISPYRHSGAGAGIQCNSGSTLHITHHSLQPSARPFVSLTQAAKIAKKGKNRVKNKDILPQERKRIIDFRTTK